MITIGVDAHERTHTMFAIDGTGAMIGEQTVSAVPTGHAQALRWAVELATPTHCGRSKNAVCTPGCSNTNCSRRTSE